MDMDNQTQTKRSADGTQIVLDVRGEGAAVILVD